ncbi:hypothetical protein HPB51_020202 [Rhipicephalus microplus]|uniref:Uncharacterized protein n=1 Tax=Rhipicephalus microplus TaxID=6941 RepID=A0A9J6D6Q1_RHIMP|nr:hypothetical protein HPB51_020202 [Rhipicephalus microplus]
MKVGVTTTMKETSSLVRYHEAVDPTEEDESKLKAVQELSEELESIVTSVHYPTFLDHAMRVFLRILQEGKPQFIAEHNMQVSVAILRLLLRTE